jgi:CBS domain-containing protein
MPISEICSREVVYVQRDNSTLEAAKLMRQYHVGDLVVVDDDKGVKVPVGIITDRDLVVEIMATGLDPTAITVGDVMTPELAVVKEDAGLYESIQYMRAIGVRRLPVVNTDGGLVGILTLDDLLELLAEEMSTLAKLVKHEHKKETINRR